MASTERGQSSLRRWARRAGRVLLLLAGGFGLYVLLLLYPGTIFANEVRYGNLVLHATQPLAAEAVGVARAAHERIARSPY